MGGSGSYSIGPGIWAFVAFFVMAIGLWLLVRNMIGRLRRMAYQDRDSVALGHETAPSGARNDSAGKGRRSQGPESGASDVPADPDAGDAPAVEGQK